MMGLANAAGVGRSGHRQRERNKCSDQREEQKKSGD
jgi:hypothetical protein